MMLGPHFLLLLLSALLVAAENRMSLEGKEARTRLHEGRKLIVWLQNVEEAAIEKADPDILVVDYSTTGGPEGERSSLDVERLRKRPNGSSRVVLAYLSVGEAEDYRFYWQEIQGRRLVSARSPRWPGNYKVRYWKQEWHDIVYGRKDSYLQRIISQGFDGVFLDTVDACEWWEDVGIEDAPEKMAELVISIAHAARNKRPDFLLIAQNPFRILDFSKVVSALDGISCEAYLFPKGRKASKTAWSKTTEMLIKAKAQGLAILVIEYPVTSNQRETFFTFCKKHGFACFAGTPALDNAGVQWREEAVP